MTPYKGGGAARRRGPEPRPLPSPVCFPTEYRFELPFPIAGKKNKHVAVGEGKFKRVVVLDEVRKVQDYIRLVVAAEVAHRRGQITDERRLEIYEMAQRRRDKEGVGQKAVQNFWLFEWTAAGYTPAFEEEKDVVIDVEVIVGLTTETDRVIVTARLDAITWKRRRNGRQRDLDGTLATIMDGLEKSLLHDDSQASHITIRKTFEIEIPKPKKATKGGVT